ncbi:MAG TPA: calcium-binding protein, partial [Thermoleophilaceae bacterium]
WERLAGTPPGSEPYFATAHVTGGVLYAAVRDYIGAVNVYRYTETGTWQQLGGMANPAPGGEPVPTSTTALASSGGVIHVLHTVPATADAVYVTRFVNGSWEIVGPGIIGEGPASSLRVIGGRLYAAWTGARSAQVQRLDAAGTAWGGGAPLPFGTRSAVLTGVGGVPYAAVQGPDGRLQAFRLDGTTPAGPDDSDDSEPPKPLPQPACGKERVGTKYRDKLTGTSARDTLRGLGGDDRILGLGGADCLFGDAGDDRVEGGDGDDELDGGSGDDRLIGGAGYDTVRGGSGDDVIDSRGKGWDTIDCGAGYDRALVGDLDRVRNCERVQNVD